MRSFSPVTITPLSDDFLLEPSCEAWCGSTLNEIVGRLDGELLCSVCYEESKTRAFMIMCYGNADVMCEGLTLESAMAEIASYLASPVDWARYAPFDVVAYNEIFGLREIICTVAMPDDEIKRSRQVYYGNDA